VKEFRIHVDASSPVISLDVYSSNHAVQEMLKMLLFFNLLTCLT